MNGDLTICKDPRSKQASRVSSQTILWVFCFARLAL
jgi:hypothetical protein